MEEDSLPKELGLGVFLVSEPFLSLLRFRCLEELSLLRFLFLIPLSLPTGVMGTPRERDGVADLVLSEDMVIFEKKGDRIIFNSRSQ